MLGLGKPRIMALERGSESCINWDSCILPQIYNLSGHSSKRTTDLSPFEMIVPCGIKDCRMGSIKEILEKDSDGRGIDETTLINDNDWSP
ncbi:unnamed protein product [Urochloa humidicola]